MRRRNCSATPSLSSESDTDDDVNDSDGSGASPPSHDISNATAVFDTPGVHTASSPNATQIFDTPLVCTQQVFESTPVFDTPLANTQVVEQNEDTPVFDTPLVRGIGFEFYDEVAETQCVATQLLGGDVTRQSRRVRDSVSETDGEEATPSPTRKCAPRKLDLDSVDPPAAPLSEIHGPCPAQQPTKKLPLADPGTEMDGTLLLNCLENKGPNDSNKTWCNETSGGTPPNSPRCGTHHEYGLNATLQRLLAEISNTEDSCLRFIKEGDCDANATPTTTAKDEVVGLGMLRLLLRLLFHTHSRKPIFVFSACSGPRMPCSTCRKPDNRARWHSHYSE
jgi:hypothetical protein